MQRFKHWIGLAAMAWAVSPGAWAGIPSDRELNDWDVVQIEPESVWVKPTFLEDEPVLVRLEEVLPSTCYRPAPVHSEVDLAGRKVILRDQAFLSRGGLCAMLVLPTSRWVDLGRLFPGSYELLVASIHGQVRSTARFEVVPAWEREAHW